MKRRCSNRKLFFKLILLWSIAIVGYILYIEDCFLGSHSKYFYALNKAEFFVNGKKSGSTQSKSSYDLFKFNVTVSDLVPLNRTVPDYRFDSCKSKSYDLLGLPNVSIIIIFYNEAWSTLVRTLWSVILQTPASLLHEIILVDDASYMDHLGEQLDVYVAGLPVVVKVMRVAKRRGLVHARMIGANVSTASTLVFLDSHCECSSGWLPPLLHHVAQCRNCIASPLIDIIDYKTFEYRASSSNNWGAFNWLLTFKWYPVSKKERIRRQHDDTLPIRTPAIAGGLFAVDRFFFFQQGAYDPGMSIWGAENLEISLRTWMCGGELLIVPCSRVGHVYRKETPYTFPGGVSRVLDKNSARVAEVWMDQWKHLYYTLKHNAVGSSTAGDVEERVGLRRRLACKDFRWYLTHVFHHSQFPINHRFLGQFKNMQSGQCLKAIGRQPHFSLLLAPCLRANSRQLFIYNEDMTLQNENQCLYVSQNLVKLRACSLIHPRGKLWRWNNETLQHVSSSFCLTVSTSHNTTGNDDNNNNNKNYSNNNNKDALRVAVCSPQRQQQWGSIALDWKTA